MTHQLSEEERLALSQYDSYMRLTLSKMMLLFRDANVLVMQQFALDNVDATLILMDGKDEVPNSTGLAGAKPLTVDEFAKLREMLHALVVMAGQNMPLIVKAIGVNAE